MCPTVEHPPYLPKIGISEEITTPAINDARTMIAKDIQLLNLQREGETLTGAALLQTQKIPLHKCSSIYNRGTKFN